MFSRELFSIKTPTRNVIDWGPGGKVSDDMIPLLGKLGRNILPL